MICLYLVLSPDLYTEDVTSSDGGYLARWSQEADKERNQLKYFMEFQF